MWTADLSDCWLNTPDVRTADDDVGPWTAADQDGDFLDNFNAAADPAGQAFHSDDVTFQTATADDPLSPAQAAIPLPVLQFYDAEDPLEQRLVTPPVLTKAIRPDFNTTSAGDDSSVVVDLCSVRPGDGPVSCTAFKSPLSEPRQEQFVLIQLPLNSEDIVSIISRVTNNNEFVVDNSSSSETHRHHDHEQQQQQPSPEDHISTSNAAVPCSGDHRHTSGDKTGSDVTRMSEEDVLRLLDDAESIMVHSPTTADYILRES